MLDFFTISDEIVNKNIVIQPDMNNGEVTDLMIRGGKFYAFWDADKNMWNQNQRDIVKIVDRELYDYAKKKYPMGGYTIKTLKSNNSGAWKKYVDYINKSPDNFVQLDSKITFANTKTTKKDYVSKRLEYNLEEGPCEAYTTLMSTLYDPEERDKIEWAIGSIVAGDSKDIQKFIVLYGGPGSGKGTVLKIIEQLFDPYHTKFKSSSLGSQSHQFSTEPFKNNPLVAVESDGNLSKIEDNTTLNTIVSHESLPMNAKYEKIFTGKVNALLFIGSNSPVKITDGKSGLLRRLIDVNPTGNTFPANEYESLMSRIKFELGAIAYHCLEVYKSLGKNYYIGYRPLSMMYKTNAFYNYVEYYYDVFSRNDGITAQEAWTLYKTYSQETNLEYKMPEYRFREELKNYFDKFDLRTRVNGKQVRKYYSGFKKNKFAYDEDYKDFGNEDSEKTWLEFKDQDSLFDEAFRSYPAQYDAGGKRSKPKTFWDACLTVLSDIDTRQLHWVKVPAHLICVDFDIKDENGNKSFELNKNAASKFPPTYAELSKSGGGIHLYYIYNGDVSLLSSHYDTDVEVKVYTGNAALRRRLTQCNDIPVNEIKSGLPLKGEPKNMINIYSIRTEVQLRSMIEKCLNMEYEKVPPHHAPNISFIKKLLDEAYANPELSYDLRILEPRVSDFGDLSSNQKKECKDMVMSMHFCSKDVEYSLDSLDDISTNINVIDNGTYNYDDVPLTFFDVEVLPNIFVLVYKEQNKVPVAIVNYKNQNKDVIKEVLYVIENKNLAGFNNRKYDNHILHGVIIGYDNENLHKLSHKIINGDKDAKFKDAYSYSYTDIYDYCSTKQSLKKWEIELGLKHQEFPLSWDQEVPEDMVDLLVEYCTNDVIATEAVHEHNKGDWKARQMLAKLTGMTYNDTTNKLTEKLIFGDDKNPELIYTDLATGEQFDRDNRCINILDVKFPEYRFEFNPKDGKWHNYYKGYDVGFGGLVLANPGIYVNVDDEDSSSHHPHTIDVLNLFGKHTEKFRELLRARIAIKRGDFDTARKMFDGKLAEFLEDESNAPAIAQALKIAINSVYGLTSAKFKNPFKDERNRNNIVALRGALFMIDLKEAIESKGYSVVHIKTDSIKVPKADVFIVQFIREFALKYGYEFETEAVFDRFCLLNDAVFIAKYKTPKIDKETGKEVWWYPKGAQFQNKYVFKQLFSHEPITFKDMCETKTSKDALYLDLNENLPDVSAEEKELSKLTTKFRKIAKEKLGDKAVVLTDEESSKVDSEMWSRMKELEKIIATGHNYIFIGKTGLFTPVKDGCGGGRLMTGKDGKYSYATGAKGYRWLESDRIKDMNREDDIDIRYFAKLIDDAKDAINEFGDFDRFVSDEPYEEVFDITDDELPF